MGDDHPTVGEPRRPVEPTSEPTAEERELLADLAAGLATVDPVPPALVTAAKASLTWRTIDAEIAALVADSATEPASVRGPGGRRLLTFEAGSTAVVVEVSPAGHARRLLGQIVRPRPAEVEVRHAGGSLSVNADEMGRFTVEQVPAGPVSLVCRFRDPASRPVCTSWVSV